MLQRHLRRHHSLLQRTLIDLHSASAFASRYTTLVTGVRALTERTIIHWMGVQALDIYQRCPNLQS
jgi:hypothetical protein